MCNIYCYSTATIVTRTRLSVTLYGPAFLLFSQNHFNLSNNIRHARHNKKRDEILFTTSIFIKGAEVSQAVHRLG
jgi:hypothetical protein